jgi:hypothetical protein
MSARSPDLASSASAFAGPLSEAVRSVSDSTVSSFQFAKRQFNMLRTHEVPVKCTPISTFQSKCHSIVKHVHATEEPMIVTKYGKPFVTIVAIKSQHPDIFGFMTGEFQIIGDIESPVFSQ